MTVIWKALLKKMAVPNSH